METKYIVKFDEFKHYCEKVRKNAKNMDGNCSHCIQKKFCYFDNKECLIDSLMHMESIDTRFPRLLNFLQKRPEILYTLPSTLYKETYGLYQQNISCPFNANLIINSIDRIEKTYHLLNDKESQMTFLNILMYRLTLNREYAYRAYSMYPQYFIPEFCRLTSDKIYVDCGAYNGDSFISYCRHNSVPQKAYLFEPDKKNKTILDNFLQEYKINCELKTIEKGVYKFTGTLFFVEGKGVVSHFTEHPIKNSITLEVTSIDDSVVEDVSFIKMDIEGFEKEALLGAKNHIEGTYPKLAICIYHYCSDLWEIPLMIADMFPKYNNYKIRHHTKFNNETVLYAY